MSQEEDTPPGLLKDFLRGVFPQEETSHQSLVEEAASSKAEKCEKKAATEEETDSLEDDFTTGFGIREHTQYRTKPTAKRTVKQLKRKQ
eukprot:g17666.t1